MSLAAFQKKYDDFYMPRFEIDIAGTRFTETSGVVSGLSVSNSLDKADRFSFTLNNLFNPERQRFEDLDWTLLDKKGAATISMGYGNALEQLFVGRVESAEPEFPANGVPMIDVSGFGRSHELMRGTRSETWKAKPSEDRVKDSAVVSEMLKRGYGFKNVIVDETDLEFRRIVQDNRSDYDFLRERAQRYNYEAFAHRDVFHFRPPADRKTPDLQLAYGESLTSFSLSFDKSKDISEITVRGSDPKGRHEIEASAKGNDPTGKPRVIRTPVESKKEAKRIAESEVTRIRQGKIRGQGETIGLPELVPGKTVQLDGLTERFSGTYYIESTNHRISTSGYTTSFQVRKVRPEER